MCLCGVYDMCSVSFSDSSIYNGLSLQGPVGYPDENNQGHYYYYVFVCGVGMSVCSGNYTG